MGKINLVVSRVTADELSQKLAVALIPVPPTLEERVSALEGRKIWSQKTGDFAERLTTITAPPGHPYIYRPLFSMALPDINVGDLIHAESMFEVTNVEAGSRYMVAQYLVLADSADSVLGDNLNKASGTNVEYLRHHETVELFGSFRATSAMVGKFVNMILYSQRLGANGAGSLKVEQNYGHLQVTIIPSSMLA